MLIKKLMTIALAALTVALSGHAQAFQISTMVHEIEPARSPFSDFYIFNDSPTEPLHLLITLQDWTQAEDGSRILRPTDEITVFPNLLVIEPGERRKVRIGLQQSLSPDVEHAYRLNVRQLAIQGASSGAAAQSDSITGAISFTRSFDMPVFVRPAAPAQEVAVRAVALDGKIGIELRNMGNVNLKLRDLALFSVADGADSEPVSRPISAIRLLANSRIVVGTVSVSDLKNVAAVEPQYKVSSGDADEDGVGEKLRISE